METTLREDWRLRRWLYQSGRGFEARCLERLPCLEIHHSVECAWDYDSPAPGDFANVPWDEFLISSGHGWRILHFRRGASGRFMKAVADGVFELVAYREHDSWEEGLGSVGEECRSGIFSETVGYYNSNNARMQARDDDALWELDCGWFFSAICSLTDTDTRRHDNLQPVLVETHPAHRDLRSARLKPWTRRDLPRVIFLDHTTARDHGHGTSHGGTHASPRIHERRGHWNTLRHEKFNRSDDGTPRKVWVRPTWVGEREWEYRGNTYRVITAK